MECVLGGSVAQRSCLTILLTHEDRRLQISMAVSEVIVLTGNAGGPTRLDVLNSRRRQGPQPTPTG